MLSEYLTIHNICAGPYCAANSPLIPEPATLTCPAVTLFYLPDHLTPTLVYTLHKSIALVLAA